MIHNVHLDGGPCAHKRCKGRRYQAECDECGERSILGLAVVGLRQLLRGRGWKVDEFRRALCPGCWGQQWASRDAPIVGLKQATLWPEEGT